MCMYHGYSLKCVHPDYPPNIFIVLSNIYCLPANIFTRRSPRPLYTYLYIVCNRTCMIFIFSSWQWMEYGRRERQGSTYCLRSFPQFTIPLCENGTLLVGGEGQGAGNIFWKSLNITLSWGQ